MAVNKKTVRRLFGLVALVLLVPAAIGYWWVNFYPNFDTVVDGELYRSAQLTPSQLKSYISEKQIATVINLRGAEPNEGWWLAETACCKESGVTHHDFAWTNSNPPSKKELLGFVEVCRNTPKPVLVHCRGGADRTALACALYLHHLKHRDEAEARECYSVRYGHIPWASSSVRKWNELFFCRDD